MTLYFNFKNLHGASCQADPDEILFNYLKNKTMTINTETAPGQKTLNITRTFDLPITKVWQAWTEPESCQKWWGPKNFTCPFCAIDLNVGGEYLSCMRSADGSDFWSTGVYKEIIFHKKLVCTDSFSDEKGNIIPASDLNMPGDWPLELLVTISFEEVEGKTRMLLKHEGLPEEMYNDCQMGWEQSFDKLEENFK